MRRTFVCFFLCMGALACPHKLPTPDPACEQEPPQVDPDTQTAAVTAAWMGNIRVAQTQDALNGNAVHSTVAAVFYDMGTYQVETETPLQLSPTCVGRSGQPAPTGTRYNLAVERVDLGGLAEGPLALTNPDGGSLSSTLAAPLFGNTNVTASVVGADGGFLSVTIPETTPPPMMSVLEPDLSGSFSVGQENLTLRWAGSSSGTVLIEVAAASGNTARASLRCLVKDDGCHAIPSGALLWLTQNLPDPLSVSLRRGVSRGVLATGGPDGGAVAFLTLATEARGQVRP